MKTREHCFEAELVLNGGSFKGGNDKRVKKANGGEWP